MVTGVLEDLFLVTGEISGDLQGAHLVEALLKKAPLLKLSGVTGPCLRALNVFGDTRMEELQVMGFVDVLLALPRIIRLFYKIRREILDKNPEAVVFVDYPGMNLRLARSLRKAGYQGKLIQYICPTVWAWGKKRIPLMAEHLDLLLTLFPFEPACFTKTSLPTFYVGHPLIEKTVTHIPFKNFRRHYHIGLTKKILALFPGSREKEILRNFPLQLAAAKKLKEQHDLQIVISLSQEKHRPLFKGLPLIEPEHRYDLMQEAHLAIATSGTVTLELALFNTPSVVNYAIRSFDVFCAQKIFKINLPYYCIVNILSQKEVYPELFGPNLTLEALTEKASDLWTHQEECLTNCAKTRNLLESAKQSAAARILDFLS